MPSTVVRSLRHHNFAAKCLGTIKESHLSAAVGLLPAEGYVEHDPTFCLGPRSRSNRLS
jgi:hypothetical protein